MKTHLVKHHWLDRAIQIYNFHVKQLKDESNWTVEKTAKILNRSIGSVSQDLLLASWSKTHEKQLRRCSSMRDALALVRMKQKEIRLDEI
jgi:hypothetical protein